MVGLWGLALTLTLLSAASAADPEPAVASTKQFDPKTKSGTVIELTEANFDELIQEDVWLLDLYATWCSHCRQLEPVWKQLAAELKDNPDIHVAKIDGPRNRIIMSQLRVEAFPSIFLLRDSRMWPYTGPRNSEAIIQFATAGYKAEEPLRPHRCPNHKIGRIVMKMYSLPNKIKEAYTHLKEEHKWSDLGILIAVLGVPVISGVATICLMDAMYLRKARRGDEDDLYEAPAAPPAAPAPAIR